MPALRVVRPAERGRVPIDVMHSSTGTPPQDLVHKGLDIIAALDCTPDPTPTETPTPTESHTPDPTPTESTPPDDDDDLPDTGAGVGPLAGLGFGLLILAAGAVYLNRRANRAT